MTFPLLIGGHILARRARGNIDFKEKSVVVRSALKKSDDDEGRVVPLQNDLHLEKGQAGRMLIQTHPFRKSTLKTMVGRFVCK